MCTLYVANVVNVWKVDVKIVSSYPSYQCCSIATSTSGLLTSRIFLRVKSADFGLSTIFAIFLNVMNSFFFQSSKDAAVVHLHFLKLCCKVWYPSLPWICQSKSFGSPSSAIRCNVATAVRRDASSTLPQLSTIWQAYTQTTNSSLLSWVHTQDAPSPSKKAWKKGTLHT